MPVKCVKKGDKFRVVESESGDVSKTTQGTPRDGGGHDTREECQSQANAINANRQEMSPENNQLL